MGWEDVADELYGLPPEEFTAARDRAARRAPRGQGAKIRALRRPTLAAWAVNLLVRHDREQITALLGLGEQLRRAHRELNGRQLRDLSQQQRQLVSALARQAQQLAVKAGRRVGESVLREIEATVQAALADPDAAREVATGRLAKPLTPAVGFGPPGEATIHRLRPAPSAAPGRAERERPAEVTDLAARRRQQDEQARRERAERERLAHARRQAEALERAARASAKQARTADRELADSEQWRQRAEARVEELQAELRRAREDLGNAKKAERTARAKAQRAHDTAGRDRERAETAGAQAEQLRTGSPRGTPTDKR